MSQLCAIIIADDANLRDTALESVCGTASYHTLLSEIQALEEFRHQRTNLYERVRALFFYMRSIVFICQPFTLQPKLLMSPMMVMCIC